MTTTSALIARKREGTGKGAARKLRASGRVPAVLYGGDGGSQALSVDATEATHLFSSISVDNTIVDLQVEGEKGHVQTLIRYVQTHPVRADLIHIDFLRIQKGVAVDIDVPVRLEGVPSGVRLHGGTVDQIIHDLPVRCIPSQIPEAIVFDMSEADIGDVVRVEDLDLGEGVEATIDPHRTVGLVAAPRGTAEVEGEEEVEEGVEGAEEAAAEPAEQTDPES